MIPMLASAQIAYQSAFDNASDVDDWTVISPVFSSLTFEPNEDANGSMSSGSMLLANSAGLASGTAQFQYCISSVAPDMVFEVRLAARMPLLQSTTGRVGVTLQATSNLTCSGTLGSGMSSNLLTTASASWSELRATSIPTPLGTQAVWVRILITKTENTGTLEILIDDVVVTRTDIFSDGFESGSTGEWSQTVP